MSPRKKTTTVQGAGKKRKDRLVFNAKTDIALLKTVIQQEVWISNDWKLAAVDLTSQGLEVTNKSVKDRCQLLMRGFKSSTLSNMRSSGTEEEIDERSTLLANLTEFWESEQLIKTHGPENDEEEDVTADVFDESEVLSVISSDTTASSSTQVPQVPTKRARLEEKRLADRERDSARDKALANSTTGKAAIPDRLKTKKQAHLDLVEEKLRLDIDVRQRELVMRETEQAHKIALEKQEVKIKEESRRQEFELKQKELLLEARRLTLQLEANTNNTLMIKLLESALKNK